MTSLILNYISSHLTNIDYTHKFEAEKCNSNSNFQFFSSFKLTEPKNLLFFQMSSDVMWGI